MADALLQQTPESADPPPQPRRSRATTALWAILGVAFGARLVLFVTAIQDPGRFYSPDGREYWALGQHFRAAYAETSGSFFELGLKRTPGYPAVIASVTSVVGGRESAVVFAQILMSVATIALVYVLVKDMWGARAGLMAAAFLAVDPISVIMPIYLQPETLFTLMLVAGTVLLVRGIRRERWVPIVGAGAMFGLSVLVRPVSLYLFIVLIPVVWVLSAAQPWRTRLLASGAVFLAFLVPVGGWIVRNYQATDAAILSTIEGRDLLRYRAAHSLAFDEGISIGAARRQLIDRVNAKTSGDNAAQYSRAETAEAVRTMLRHPVGAGVSSVRGAARLTFGPGRAELFRVLGWQHPNSVTGIRILIVGVEMLLLLALLAAAVAGAVIAALRRRWKPFAVGVGFAAYFVLISSSGGAFSRYRAPAAPYLAMLAGIGVAVMLAAWTRRPSPHRQPAGQMLT